MTSSPAPVMWRLGRSLPEEHPRQLGSARVGLAEELRVRERALGLLPGSPFLLRPDGAADAEVVAFFASSTFKLLSDQTQLSYAKDLRLFLSFLESQSKSWRDATCSDLLDFEHWRRRDALNPRRVSGAKFSRELAACKKFFDWQRQRGAIATDPTVFQSDSLPDGDRSSPLRPRDARPTRVKWLTPLAFRQWRDVGLGGYLLDGSPDRSWRGRSGGRNVAFADLLWSSGLRLREGGTLLRSELPEPRTDARYLRARVGHAVAKGRGRDFWMAREARLDVEAYVVSTRAAAIARAQREGRYDALTDRLLILGTERTGLRVQDVGSHETRTVRLDQLGSRDRARLFVDGAHGLEPAMLFLGESGMPMHFESWEAVFAGASRRCARLEVPVSCYPHMLRHSFALRMLVTLLHAFDRRMGLTPQERRDYRLLFGDPWTLVQTLLGHTNPQTTRDIYLEPVSGLQVDLFLNGDGASDGDAFTDFVQRHLMATGLVNPGLEGQ